MSRGIGLGLLLAPYLLLSCQNEPECPSQLACGTYRFDDGFADEFDSLPDLYDAEIIVTEDYVEMVVVSSESGGTYTVRFATDPLEQFRCIP